MSFTRQFFAWPCVLSDRPPVLWWLSHGEGLDALTLCGWDKLKRVQLQKIKVQIKSIWAKVFMLMIVCVLSDLTSLPLLGGGRNSWYII